MQNEEDILLRRGREEELHKLIEVYQSSYRRIKKYAYNTKRKIKGYLKWLYRGDPEGFWVAEKKDELIGFVSIHSKWKDSRWGRTGELHEIAVREEFQRKGIGKRLLRIALRYARKRGCRFVSLWVGEENFLARSWYERLGFEEKGKWGEWVRMRMSLSLPGVEQTDKDKGKKF